MVFSEVREGVWSWGWGWGCCVRGEGVVAYALGVCFRGGDGWGGILRIFLQGGKLLGGGCGFLKIAFLMFFVWRRSSGLERA